MGEQLGQIVVDHHPAGNGFVVCPDGRARERLPNFPDQIAFWSFAKKKAADEWAAKLAAKATGLEVWDKTAS